MADLVVAPKNTLSKVVVNTAGAAAVAGFTAYMTGCVLVFHDDHEFSKKELLAELWSAAYVTWIWYMGLGPEPEVNTGIPHEVPRCKELTTGR